ncbi:MAG TPA: molecular chaperone TorD family protein [Actinomycetota bacterium]|nr:molecular chaperone TorD family protein [Actinomycetota bacterium]
MRTDTASALEAPGALARSAVLGLLSQALAYPTARVVRDLLEEDLPFALALSGALPEEVAGALGELAAALEGVTAVELEEAFRDRFTHVHSRDCPLYETDHASREVWRQAADLADLGGFYRAFGLEESGERVDHVSVELEFLHVLAYKRAWALERGQAEHAEVCRLAEETFLRDHVLRWLPDVAERLRAIGTGSPYAAVGALMGEVLRAESVRTGVPITAREPVEPVAGPEEVALCEEPS